jgi:hypothetical protein
MPAKHFYKEGIPAVERLLWFVKGKKIREGFNYMADSIRSARPHNKYLHEWQQST